MEWGPHGKVMRLILSLPRVVVYDISGVEGVYILQCTMGHAIIKVAWHRRRRRSLDGWTVRVRYDGVVCTPTVVREDRLAHDMELREACP
jgi:hypothetical protein